MISDFLNPSEIAGFFFCFDAAQPHLEQSAKGAAEECAPARALFTQEYRPARIAGAKGNSPAIIFSRQERRQPSPCVTLARLHRFARRCRFGFLFVREKCLLASVASRLRAPRRCCRRSIASPPSRRDDAARERARVGNRAFPRPTHVCGHAQNERAISRLFRVSFFFGPSRVALL